MFPCIFPRSFSLLSFYLSLTSACLIDICDQHRINIKTGSYMLHDCRYLVLSTTISFSKCFSHPCFFSSPTRALARSRCWVSRDSPPWRTQLRRRPTESRDPEVFGKDGWERLLGNGERSWEMVHGADISDVLQDCFFF